MICKDPQIDQKLQEIAMSVVSDSLFTDCALLFPPFYIALGCLIVAASQTSKNLKKWILEMNIDYSIVYEVAQKMTEYYSIKDFDEIMLKDFLKF